jgi:hypothetical protein
MLKTTRHKVGDAKMFSDREICRGRDVVLLAVVSRGWRDESVAAKEIYAAVSVLWQV